MVKQHYRWDFIGLSTDTKPTPQESEKVTNGSTFYESDTSKLYVFYQTQWYEKTATGGGGGDTSQMEVVNLTITGATQGGVTVSASKYSDEVRTLAASNKDVVFKITIPSGSGLPAVGTYQLPLFNYTDDTIVSMSVVDLGGTLYSILFAYDNGTHINTGVLTLTEIQTGGGGPTVVQTTGTSTTDVMSQNATTSLVYRDTSNLQQIQMGKNASANASYAISIGAGSTTSDASYVGGNNSIAIGHSARTNRGQNIAIGYNAQTGTYDGSNCISIGSYALPNSNDCVAIGPGLNSSSDRVTVNAGRGVAIGYCAKISGTGSANSVSLGAFSDVTRAGEVSVGCPNGYNYGYNGTTYRVIGGVHDPVDAHDAATKGYVDAKAGFFNIENIVQAAYENPDVPQTITLQEYEALEEACMDFLPLAYYHYDGYTYTFVIIPSYDCNPSSDIVVNVDTISYFMGKFTFQYNNGQPYVTFTAV